MIELRWLVDPITGVRKLQYRTFFDEDTENKDWSNWKDVPTHTTH